MKNLATRVKSLSICENRPLVKPGISSIRMPTAPTTVPMSVPVATIRTSCTGESPESAEQNGSRRYDEQRVEADDAVDDDGGDGLRAAITISCAMNTAFTKSPPTPLGRRS